ncbi:protein MTSS 2-like isoform X2 [Mya arenaria]|uniref:protein MTSS 2-like isoform X2 n=1 Tax=Mya arenaria TaxID=6604 RepID=UPI0022E3B36E|nr:protein MTSS 2-like isoform X2 [Mya arenaria]
MDGNIDKDIGAFGALFLNIISEMRGSTPIWEDFTSKASKLHTSLKGTLTAIAAFLDAFQKVADMATSSRGATKELGTAMTRLCMRHKAIESKLKKFTGTIVDHLVSPLQECMEDWKKSVIQLDKEHTKDYKRAKQDIKKCAADTVRLQKKVKKAANGTNPTSPLWFDEGKADMQSRLDSAMQDVNDKYLLLEEQEKNSLRNALIEERSRFCLFVSCLKPFVDEEISLLTEVTHLQEIMESLCLQADSPATLPPASEQVIRDLKGTDSTTTFTLQTPPSSPSSLGSRKSSMCSINSIASSSSGSAQSHSPCHNKNLQQLHGQLLGSGVRLTSVSSQDSGFTSQDTLFLRPTTPSSLSLHTQPAETSQDGDTPEIGSTPSTPSESYPNTPSAMSTWTNWPNLPVGSGKTEQGRPHTISSAYEKSHYSRPALSSQLFQPPGSLDGIDGSQPAPEAGAIKRDRPHSVMSVPYSRPSAQINKMQPVLPPLGPKPKSRAVAPPKVPPIGEQPVYANLSEISPQGTSVDLDKTPTSLDPPSMDSKPLVFAEIDLTEAIRDLDNYTAALHGDFTPGDRKSKMEQNTLELAAAIKELEASTAALEKDTQASQSSLHTQASSSSGYGTMNSTPATSEDPLASGEYLDTGQADYAREQKKYNTIPRNSPVIKAAFQFKRPASTIIGMPMSAQLARRSSMNVPKPPPPVRRSSSISTASNPAILQKFRNSPPRQLNQSAGPPQVSAKPIHQGQGNHRRSLSACGGSEPEHAYAELTEIQASIQARQQQVQGGQIYAPGQVPGQVHPGMGYGAMSAPATPQYAQPVNPVHPQTTTNSNIVNSLNARFAAMNTNMAPQQSNNNSSSGNSISIQSNCVVSNPQMQNSKSASTAGLDLPDLPPPPSEDELRAMDQIYSVPNQNLQQTQAYNTQSMAHTNSVQMRQPQAQYQQPQPVNPAGTDVRTSLISEMKSGNKFRKMTNSERGSEC